MSEKITEILKHLSSTLLFTVGTFYDNALEKKINALKEQEEEREKVLDLFYKQYELVKSYSHYSNIGIDEFCEEYHEDEEDL